MKNEIEKNIEEIEDSLESEKDKNTWEKFWAWRKESNGFATKKGGYYDKAEGHAIGIGIAPMALGFLLPTPMGELYVLMQLGWMKIAADKWARGEKMHGHLGDVAHEIGYTVLFALLTAIFFIQFTDYGLTSIDISSLVLAMVGGA